MLLLLDNTYPEVFARQTGYSRNENFYFITARVVK